MKKTSVLSFAAAALTLWAPTSLRAETFPIFEDTSGSPLSNTIRKANGAGKTTAISAKNNAYVSFGVASSGIDPATVTGARLIVFFSKVTKKGTIAIRNLNSGFAETFTEATRPLPTLGNTIETIDLNQFDLNREFFIVDMTDQVKAWLTTPASEFGIAIVADATANCTIATKEGAASGHPAILEVDVNRPGGTLAGTSASFTSDVGIGTTTPSTRLGVAANAANAGVARFDNANAAGYAGIYFDQAGVYRGNVGYVNSNSGFGAPGTMQLGAASDIVFSANSAGFFEERMRIKVDSGSVGIGTSAPEDGLHVALTSPTNTGGTRILVSAANTGFAGYRMRNTNREFFSGILASNDSWSLFDNTAQALRMTITANGRFGFNSTDTPATFNFTHPSSGVAGDFAFRIRHTEGANGVTASDFAYVRTFVNGGPLNLELFEGNAFKPGGGSWGVVSDRRLKKDIEPLSGALDHLMRLRSVTYEYIDPASSHQFAGTQTGFIAQEVEQVFPEWVTENAEGYKAVTIRGFESLTVQALRELRTEKNAEIAALQNENAALREKLAAMEAREQAADARLTRLENALNGFNPAPVQVSLVSEPTLSK